VIVRGAKTHPNLLANRLHLEKLRKSGFIVKKAYIFCFYSKGKAVRCGDIDIAGVCPRSLKIV
jgi:hypothetical protein